MNVSRRPQKHGAIAPSSAFETFYRDHYDAISRHVARQVPPGSHDEIVAATFVAAVVVVTT